MSFFWMAGRKPCLITSCMRYIVIFEVSGNVPVYAPVLESLKNVFLGTFYLTDNAFQERCGIKVDPKGSIYSMLQLPAELLSLVLPSAVAAVLKPQETATACSKVTEPSSTPPSAATPKFKAPPVIPRPSYKAPPAMPCPMPKAMPMTSCPAESAIPPSRVPYVPPVPNDNSYAHTDSDKLPPYVNTRIRHSLLMHEAIVTNISTLPSYARDLGSQSKFLARRVLWDTDRDLIFQMKLFMEVLCCRT